MFSKEDLRYRLAMQNDVFSRVRQFFASREFVEIPYVPLLTKYPGQEPNLDPMEVDLILTNPSQNIKAGLITSPEYVMKKLIGSGLEKIFTITPVFRNLEANSQTNAPEFLMLEWYAPGNYDDLMQETEDLYNFVLDEDRCWARIKYEDANMVDEEPHVDKSHFFITHYPAEKASLAKVENGYAQRFEAFASMVAPDSIRDLLDNSQVILNQVQNDECSKVLELCNGFCELTDAIEQRQRFKKEQEERKGLGKTVFPIDEDLLKGLSNIKNSIYGNALGIDRLIMLKYGISDIGEVQIFPYTYRY